MIDDTTTLPGQGEHTRAGFVALGEFGETAPKKGIGGLGVKLYRLVIVDQRFIRLAHFQPGQSLFIIYNRKIWRDFCRFIVIGQCFIPLLFQTISPGAVYI